MLSFLPDLLISRFSRKREGCFILRLPNDVLVDNIFIYLRVEDVLRFRRVSQYCYYLTHQPIIWKRFLRHMNIPLPPLPPTPRYALGKLDFEIEKMVIRAISLDDNWRSYRPKLYHTRSIKVYNQVLGMTVLPGGKYLIASVRDPGSKRYAIIVYVMDHHGKNVALARTPTKSKAYNLQAKYMTHNGVQGITIAYIRREFKRGGQNRCRINPSDFAIGTDIDAPLPLRYECVCLHISLQALELLGDPRFLSGSREFYEHASKQPPPFLEISNIRTPVPLDVVALFEFGGYPYLSVVRRPDEIVIKDLTSRRISTLKCEPYEPYSELPQTIRAIQIFPAQNQILVIRTVPATPLIPESTPTALLEIYDAPQMGKKSTSNAKDRYVIDNRHISSFQISNHNISTEHDASLQPTLAAAHGPPAPISIYCQTIKPYGLLHYIIWPTRLEIPATLTSSPQIAYYYSLSNISFQSRRDSDSTISHVVPGAFRALIYTVPASDRTDSPSVLELRKYITPESQPREYPVTEDNTDEEVRIMKKRHILPGHLYRTLAIPPKLQATLRRGVTAIAWDEGIGRVCIAASENSAIYILDFAQVPKLTEENSL